MVDHKMAIVGGGHFFHLGFFGKEVTGGSGWEKAINVALNDVCGRF